MSGPPLDGEYPDLRALLHAAAVVHGDREAYVEPGARITFADWVGRARAVAVQFSDAGVGKGDVVALWLPSGIDYATCYAAAAMIGAVTTGLNPRLGPREITAVLDQADPALIVADTDLGEIDRAGQAVLLRDALAQKCAPADSLPAVSLDADDPVTVIFTSGTTGSPKGAVFDGANLAAGAAAAGVMSAPYDRRLTSTPFAHAGYMFKLWDQLVWGTTLVVPPTPWSADGMFSVLREEKITVAGAVPTQWAKLLELDGVCRDSLPHLRIGVVATAPAPPHLVRAVADRIGVALVVRYAMTECPTICGTAPDDPPEVQFQTVGRAAPGMAVCVADDGVVEVSGPCVMRGYWRDPDLTAAVLRDGWLRTGDVGVIRDDGNLSLVGRSGDMYIRGGYNIHPVEVEKVLAEHPGVKAVAVVGRPAPVIGEIGVAFVVPVGPPPALEDLRDYVKSQLADYKAPDELVIVDELPLTSMLKVDRKALRALASGSTP
ncbi:class I adenylate-forming enzyme family protein [Mycolicibacterium flavescens]|uniref:Acyl-CoA synthetase n=1 Tax=Mycolicibacterium flavescens TaxID=1776 RepID=A0A1E3RIJ2_MYCFV|nr:class I adenylate-forming enzyme family protein [Mycolicibacterium flavescens]ODQ89282.1 acyl-CoA synthetase [Mycolicibacterium flavescens]